MLTKFARIFKCKEFTNGQNIIYFIFKKYQIETDDKPPKEALSQKKLLPSYRISTIDLRIWSYPPLEYI